MLSSAAQNRVATELPTPERSTSEERQKVSEHQELIARVSKVDAARIVMHTTESTLRLADQLTDLFSALGANQVEQRLVDAVPDNNQIRYYHPADREAGQVVGDVMKLVFEDIAIRDFQNYQPSPSQGLIEIWLR